MVQKVLVTGAGGFLGQAFVRGFLAVGWRVRAADLPHIDLGALADAGAETMTMDLTKAESLPPLLKDIDTVVHNAGIFDLSAHPKRLWAINADGASLMAEASVAAGSNRFIMVSSTSVYGRASLPTREDAPKNPYHDYSASKWAGEKRSTEICERNGISMATLRPTLVYGPGSRYGISPVFCLYSLARQKKFNPIGVRNGAMTHVVHVDDVVGAAVHLAKHPELQGPFNIADEQPVSVQELTDAIQTSLGSTPSSLRFPGRFIGAIRIGKGALSLVMRPLNTRSRDAWEKLCRERNLEPKLSPRVDIDWLDFLSHDNTFDIRRLKGSGYAFSHSSIVTGIPDATRWYRSQRWLPPAH